MAMAASLPERWRRCGSLEKLRMKAQRVVCAENARHNDGEVMARNRDDPAPLRRRRSAECRRRSAVVDRQSVPCAVIIPVVLYEE